MEIIEEVQNIHVDIGETASFTCVATGTDVTISWEIDNQSYTDCSNASVCVTTNGSDSMRVSSTVAVTASLANNTRVQCTASQMCGTASSNGTLFLGEQRSTNYMEIYITTYNYNFDEFYDRTMACSKSFITDFQISD